MKEKLYTIPMMDALRAEDECPFCYIERDLEHHALEFVLGQESTFMQDDVRAETDAMGFCKKHYQQMFTYGNALGAALIIETHLKKLYGQMQKEMKHYNNFSVDHLGDIAQQMKNKKQLWKIRATMLAVGIPLEIIEIATFMLGLLKGIWWPYLIGLVLVILGSIFIIWYYDRMVSFICPECHKVFKPGHWESFWANHTPTTRKLHCPGCGHYGFCVETYQPQEEKEDE